ERRAAHLLADALADAGGEHDRQQPETAEAVDAEHELHAAEPEAAGDIGGERGGADERAHQRHRPPPDVIRSERQQDLSGRAGEAPDHGDVAGLELAETAQLGEEELVEGNGEASQVRMAQPITVRWMSEGLFSVARLARQSSLWRAF